MISTDPAQGYIGYLKARAPIDSVSSEYDLVVADLDGSKTMPETAQEIFGLLLKVASGERSKSELLDLGNHEFVPWNIGVVS